MRLNLTLLFLFSLGFLSAQNTKTFKNAIGFDAIPLIVGGSGNQVTQSAMEFTYKRKFKKGEFRIKFLANQRFGTQELLTKVNTLGTDIYSFKQQINSFGLNAGYAFYIHSQKLNLYTGFDLNYRVDTNRFSTHKGDCALSFDRDCFLISDLTVKDPTIGLIPFLGIKLPAGKRFTFTVEFGAGFNIYQTTEIIFGTDQLLTFEDSGFEISSENFINDIAVFYNF